MLKIQNFLKTQSNWKELLSQDPYNLIIKEKDNLVLFKYHQMDSDLNEPICQECRGLILEKDTWRVVRCAFFKFFNYGESLAAPIDINSMRVEEKIDGSLISLYYYENEWRIASNSNIDARDSQLVLPTEEFKNFEELFHYAAKDLDCSKLNPENTYTFELTSIYNKVVITYNETKITHIGTRNNSTLQELNEDIGIAKPKTFSFSNINDIIENANKLNYDKEGYVAVDKNYNRVKIKSPAYVAIHHLKDNGTVSKKRMLVIVLKNEKEEFLSYFPEYTEIYNEIENKYLIWKNNLINDLKEAQTLQYSDRKEFAQWACKKTYPPLLFLWLDKKISLQEFLNEMTETKLEKILRL